MRIQSHNAEHVARRGQVLRILSHHRWQFSQMALGRSIASVVLSSTTAVTAACFSVTTLVPGAASLSAAIATRFAATAFRVIVLSKGLPSF